MAVIIQHNLTETEDPIATVYNAEISGTHQSHVLTRLKQLSLLPPAPIVRAADAVRPMREHYVSHSLRSQLENDHDIFHEGQQTYHPLCPLCKLQLQIDAFNKSPIQPDPTNQIKPPPMRSSQSRRDPAVAPNVYWNSYRGKWTVRLTSYRKTRDVAYFDVKELAITAAEVAREFRKAGLSLVQIAKKFGVILNPLDD